MAVVVLLGVIFGYLWYAPARATATQLRETPAATVTSAPPVLLPADANDPPAATSSSDVCRQTDWTKAKSKDFSINCVGKGIPVYDKRLEYVYSLDQVNDWSSVKRDDPRLHDCAGLQPCEQRAQSFDSPRPLPQPRLGDRQPILMDKKSSHGKVANLATASCESVIQTWESEDPRLSSATCDGLGLLECSHIKRCLGLHDINLGPGSSKVEP